MRLGYDTMWSKFCQSELVPLARKGRDVLPPAYVSEVDEHHHHQAGAVAGFNEPSS
jgi:hypothetical protein